VVGFPAPSGPSAGRRLSYSLTAGPAVPVEFFPNFSLEFEFRC
jgi:hypothetical protein